MILHLDPPVLLLGSAYATYGQSPEIIVRATVPDLGADQKEKRQAMECSELSQSRRHMNAKPLHFGMRPQTAKGDNSCSSRIT